MVKLAIFWGPSHRNNATMLLDTNGSLPRAYLWGVATALLTAEPHHPIRIWVSCDYVHHVLCHWAPALEERQWNCTHADLLQPITRLLRVREA
ncbi:hypothetical protein GY45DRAFT_1250909, partial [Cubamyces sp. BRFM 1775]